MDDITTPRHKDHAFAFAIAKGLNKSLLQPAEKKIEDIGGLHSGPL